MNKINYIIILILILLLIDKYTIKTNSINNIIYNKNYKNYNNNIDAVITWVNSSDKKWIKNKNKYFNLEFNKKGVDNDNVRFPNIKFIETELYYCVKSINKFLPWIRNIYIVTADSQIPSFIKEFKKIKIIHHSQIFPNKKSLPTFNSHAIETCLHYIPNLSEKFIYFNDDMYVGDYLNEYFFFKNNSPIFGGKKRPMFIAWRNNPYNYAWKNLSIEYGNINVLISSHCCTPLTKTLMLNVENKFKTLWINTRNSKFRNNNDIPPIGMCINYDVPLISKFSSEKKIYGYFEFNTFINYINDVTKLKPKLFCLNNPVKENNYKKIIKIMNKILK